MAKHHHPQQQQILPRPTAPPTPMPTPVRPREEAEVRTWLALGITEERRHGVALLKTQGTKVLECTFLDSHYGHMPVKDAALAEDTWEEASYPVIYHGETPRLAKPGTLVEGKALGLVPAANGKTGAVVVEIEDGRLVQAEGQVVYLGGRKDAWHELQSWAAHNLLPNWQAERRRVARRQA